MEIKIHNIDNLSLIMKTLIDEGFQVSAIPVYTSSSMFNSNSISYYLLNFSDITDYNSSRAYKPTDVIIPEVSGDDCCDEECGDNQ